MNHKSQLYSIQQLSTKLNIPKPTLRFWEKEFEGILQPLRTNGGQRRYTSEHISIIEEIKLLKKAGLSLVEIKRKLGKGLISEAGSQRSGDERTDGIDHLIQSMYRPVLSLTLGKILAKYTRYGVIFSKISYPIRVIHPNRDALLSARQNLQL